MEAKTIAAAMFGENLLPLTIQETTVQSPEVSLDSITVTETTGFISLIDVINRIHTARAPRIPMLKRDYTPYGP